MRWRQKKLDKKNILIADDDDEIRELLEFDLSSSGYNVNAVKNGLEAYNETILSNYDLVILDVMMPKMNGFDACLKIKEKNPNLPVLLLTAKGTIEDKTAGFNAFADDYLVKPFDIQEVLLRVRALLRRYTNESGNNNYSFSSLSQNNSGVLKSDDIEIFENSLEVKINEKTIKLTPTEFEILYCLLQHKNQAVSLGTLLQEVWGYDSDEDVRMVRVHVGTLRQKIEPDPKKPVYVNTVTNVGYRLNTKQANNF